MNWIEHIVEPNRLLLTWQAPDKENRLRRIIAELIRTGDEAKLKYLTESDDYKEAVKLGFNGFAAFSLDDQSYDNVLGVFMKRLPPRTRTDFIKYLEAIRIPEKLKDKISDFALLGYSGARLPDDDFSVVHPFDGVNAGFELFTEICGFRHNEGTNILSELKEGQEVVLEKEPSNMYDPLAVKIMFNKVKLGYINRGQLIAINRWIDHNLISEVVIERINGLPGNPKVYIFIKVA